MLSTHRNGSLSGFLQQIGTGLKLVASSIFLTAVFFSAGPAHGIMDLADDPMMAVIKPAPANIMILLDDSESMTFEVLTTGYYEGRFPDPDKIEQEGFAYIFDSPEDNAFQDTIGYMGQEDRKLWKSQSHEHNAVYYNPEKLYEPWPGGGNREFLPADIEFPLLHPSMKNSGVIDLDGTSFSVALDMDALPDSFLHVKHAHYFQRAENGVIYLVVLDGDEKKTKYFAVTEVEGTGLTEKVRKVTPVVGPPGEIRVSGYDGPRQNFANWFTYHRRRGFVAIGAIAGVISNLRGVRIGILSINGRTIVPLKPVDVWKEGIHHDQTAALLHELYACEFIGDSPLREALFDVGGYYRSNLKALSHFRGRSVLGDEPPFLSEAEGGACQQSYTVIMTDGYYSYDIKDLKVGNADGDAKSPYDAELHADALSNTIADVAMHFYENDLSPDPQDAPSGNGLPDRVYNRNLLFKRYRDDAPHQHMVTYAMALGITGNFYPDKYEMDPGSSHYLQVIDKKSSSYGNYPSWPEIIESKSTEALDDLFHATVNGRGRILNAGDPEDLVTILTELTSNVLKQPGSASSISITNYKRYGGSEESTLMFQAGYITGDWRGDVKSYRIDPTTGEILDDGPVWSAADCLDLIPWHQRNVISYNGKFGVEFNTNQLTDTQKAILGPEFRNLVAYIKGENIVGYRTRSSKLGDIVHASPVFEEGFLYVGANDGMLHAFEIIIDNDGILKGDEAFAYIPSFVFENLKALADPAYRHKFYVDLTPTVGKGKGLLGGEEFKTVLVGGLGKGGKGYFALDISAPLSMTTENVLWEFPNAASQNELNDMGFSFSKPLVVRTNSAREDESWGVIFGNGYDSINGNAVLYVLNPKSGNIIKKITAHNPSVDKGNGLSSPIAVDVNADDKVDFVFVGDLNGNLWKFDLTSNDVFDWAVAYSDGIYSQPLFKAEGPDGDQQPITAKPEVMMHPEGQGLMVLFGTGSYLGQNDFTDNDIQSVYGVWDYGDRAYYPGEWGEYSEDDDQEYLGTFTRDQLSNQPQNVTLLNQTSDLYSVFVNSDNDAPFKVDLRVMSSSQPVWKTKDEMNINGGPKLPDLSDIGTSHAGWYYDLPLAGERIISDLMLRDGRLAVVSFRPDPDPCSAEASSFLMELNAFTGGSIPEILYDINQDGVIDVADTVVAGYDTNGKPVRIAPAGLKIAGNIQPPANLRLTQLVEINYMSSSTGAVHLLKSPAVQQGVIFWKELER